MTVFSETLIDGDPARYEQRYTVELLRHPLKFVRRPISIEPKEGTICWVDNGPHVGAVPRNAAASFKGGKWQGVKFEPTHWTHLDD